jgi:predicted dehydrogenase
MSQRPSKIESSVPGMTPMPRREFGKVSASVAALAAGVLAVPAPARAAGANDRLRIGFIGPGGRGFGAHVKTLAKMFKEKANIELVAVCDVYSVQTEEVCAYIKKETGYDPKKYEDYKDLLADKNVDAVCIGTPDHWHHRQIVDSLKAGKHVYCEKPMTKTVEEAFDVVDAWRESGKIMQVGVQSTSLPVWNQARELIQSGKLGKLLMFQTEYFRNSSMGQWRYYKLTKEMSPKTINWERWLGTKDGLAPDMPFDREVYAQWRRFWPFGSGMFTDLFVHRTTSMLKGTGLLFPKRVVGAGGIFLEYDGRDVPDVATVVADFGEGVQALITATMCNQETPVQQVIRGHNGSFVFGNGEGFKGFDFVPERPQVTGDSKLKKEFIETEQVPDTTYAHFKNWLDAIAADKPEACNNPPDLGAAAIATVILGAKSYRDGKVFFVDAEKKTYSDKDPGWAKGWETLSAKRGQPMQVAGWTAGDTGSKLEEPDYMSLGGPWVDGVAPEERKK